MQELLYLEIPHPDPAIVRNWLQQDYDPPSRKKFPTADGVTFEDSDSDPLSAFIWSVQRTTYLKLFRWSNAPIQGEQQLANHLETQIRQQFPHHYPEPPEIDLSEQSIFEALAPHYPETVRYFQKMPRGEYDLNRVYWWEKRWRDRVRNPQTPTPVIQPHPTPFSTENTYDLIYVGGALGAIHSAIMARRGYRVLLIERLPYGRMNREWNISRDEFQQLINLGLFTQAEFEDIIGREYIDGFNKFFDGNNPDYLKADILHTPTVLNIAILSDKLLQHCGEKLRAAGGEILDETEFQLAEVAENGVRLSLTHLPTGQNSQVQGRLLIDAMGTASPIAWQLNGTRAFDSVCPTVGAVIDGGFEPGVWDSDYGDVLNSHGDISRGRQLIWELFPGPGGELTFYLFHYHEVHPDNPGSLLEMYEDFFTILPEYRRCDMEKLVWKKPTFGYIPGHFSLGNRDRTVAGDRILAIGDAASLQSPLVFTGFGSLVRNLPRLTVLLDTALKYDLLQAEHLNAIRAYQDNTAVTWLFSKGMMVPTHRHIKPQLINSMLNTFFGLLADEPPEVADTFIKDRTTWLLFNRLALKAAFKNPALLWWIWQLAGPKDLARWLATYGSFTSKAFVHAVLEPWFPQFTRWCQGWMSDRYPGLWLSILSLNYSLSNNWQAIGKQKSV
ncbi:NAD(P)/FAD-dependent oxidoreductase [Roseofilum casamattae]|uniref:Flavin-dependent dehydrogenase n=1 Tax=Roseofilum casamattae BLCC-M143 TaxID=3022442 RepID=A0ABT7BT41_9CYAN|nr:hypothetical protein [Roseofilum casamattae]MDJ1182349.1 flavin-dependent dehydrogenase [Roseofilum casamattae BLCC-M143]